MLAVTNDTNLEAPVAVDEEDSEVGERGYGGPPIHNMGFFSRFGESPNSVETFRADADPGSELSHLGLVLPRDRDLGRV